jgi:hypothetical protein
MAQRRPFDHQRRKPSGRGSLPAAHAMPAPLPRSVPKQYGVAFVLMENERKQTFLYQNGAWVEFDRTIAECRVDCLVKQLSQKVNNMTRYEIRREVQA